MADKPEKTVFAKNLTFPISFEDRFARVRQHMGATSDSEMLRAAFVELEAKFGLSPVQAPISQQNGPEKK